MWEKFHSALKKILIFMVVEWKPNLLDNWTLVLEIDLVYFWTSLLASFFLLLQFCMC